MKNMYKKVFSFVLVLGAFLLGANYAFAFTPSFELGSAVATNITQTSATLNGTFNPNGLATTAWFEVDNGSTHYGTTSLGGGNGDVPYSYTLNNLAPGSNHTFRAVAQNSDGTTSSFPWTSFTTEQQQQQTTVALWANPQSIQSGQGSTLSWTVTGWNGMCTATAFPATSQWSGSKAWNGGPVTVFPTQTTTYTLTCNGVSDSTTVSVTTPPPQTCPPGMIGVPPNCTWPQQNAPTVNLTANPSSIQTGQSSTLTWSVSNATSCVASNGWSGNKNANGGSQVVSPTSNTTYTLTCTGPGGSASDTATVTVTQAPPANVLITNLSANPVSVSYNGSTTVTWSVTGATLCTANSTPSTSWTGSVSATGGSQVVNNLTSNPTYFNLYCTGPGGFDSKTISVAVGSQPPAGDPPTVTIKAIPASIPYGEGTEIYWYPVNATSCLGTGGTNGWAGSKYHYSDSFWTGHLYADTTYTITCSNQYGTSAAASVTVKVGNTPTPTVDINANDTTLNYGDSTYVFWSSTNATSCTANGGANGWAGTKNLTGNVSTGNLYNNTTYTITCYNGSNSNSDSVTIYVENVQQNNPSVTTYFATNVTQNSATLNGYVNTNGNSTQRWFEWGTSSGALYNSTNHQYQSYSGNFSEFVSGLQPNTTYYFRAVANGNSGNIYGNISSFTTTGNLINPNTCGFGINCAPTAVTTLATNVDQNSARLNGLGLLSGGNVATNGYFEWGTTTALGNITNNAFIGSAVSNPFYASLFTLQPNTTYYFRAVVTNQYGTARGEIRNFTTRGNTVIVNNNPRTTAVTQGSQVDRNVVSVTNVGQVEGVGTSKASLVYLTVDHNNEAVSAGSEVEYTFFYKNVSAENLRDIVLQVMLPGEFEYVGATLGDYNAETKTLVANIPSLYPGEEGAVTVRVLVNSKETGTVIAITGNLAYTVVSNGSQEEVFAYSRNTIAGAVAGIGLTGAAIFGSGFLPNTLIGWIIIILIILAVALLIRTMYAPRHGHGHDAHGDHGAH